MRKTVRTCQNKVKALLLKLEEEAGNRYHLTLAGITIPRGNCVSGFCEGGREEDHIFSEHQVFRTDQFTSFDEAEQAFEIIKERWVM